MKTVNNILFVILFSLNASAGFISSGGESFGDDKNPWFVKSVKEIKYCIRVDEPSVSVSPQAFREAVQKAFEYWKGQLKITMTAPGIAHVGDQIAVEQPICQNDTDIEFKFGYATLDKEELEFLKEPQKYIGVTIRKEYDPVTMHGRGSLYISSDKGPHAYSNTENLIEQAWSKPHLLQYALIHELGHVMGLAHTGVGVMSEMFLNQILNKRGWSFYSSRPILNAILPLDMAEVCTPALNDFFSGPFFGLAVEDKCLKIEKPQGVAEKWNVYSRRTVESEFKLVGELKTVSATQAGLTPKPLVFIYLPEEQKVFGSAELGYTNFLVGAMTRSSNFQGVFMRTGSMKPYHVQIIVDSESIQVSGVVGSEIKPVFMHTLPGLKGIVFP